MGWDCVFVGKLYNKMRVQKSIATDVAGGAAGLLAPLIPALQQPLQAQPEQFAPRPR